MDTSSKYITMCNKATEIQEIKNDYLTGSDKDFFHIIEWNQATDKMKIDFCSDISTVYQKYNKIIWLPRQDQLQEIVNNHKDVFTIDHLIYLLTNT